MKLISGLAIYVVITSILLFALSKRNIPVIRNEFSPTWSNRLGATITPIAKDIWAAERPFIWNNIDVGGRSAIIKLNDNSLFVHSPVAITTTLQNALTSIGNVKYVISPNYEHLKYAKDWEVAYPKAKRFGCPGLISKKPDVKWDLELDDKASTELTKYFEIIHINCEKNPLTNKPFFNEVIFYYKPSKALIVTDLFWNYPSNCSPNYFGVENTGTLYPTLEKLPSIAVPTGSLIWKFLMDVIYLPIYKFILVGLFNENRKKYEKIVEKILNLEIELIIPCHGDIIRGKTLCKKVLKDFF